MQCPHETRVTIKLENAWHPPDAEGPHQAIVLIDDLNTGG
jgi:hypothetical protein